VLIADDDPHVRNVLAASLHDSGAIVLAGLAGDAEDAVDIAGRTQPDVALVDFHMPGGGLRAVRGILACSPATQVVALSGSVDRTSALEMLRAGAASYVVKNAIPDEIVATVHSAARGDSILSAEIAGGVIRELADHLEQRELEADQDEGVRARIRRVVDERLIRPVFQPIVDLRSGSTVGFEALSRFDCEPKQVPGCWFAEADAVGLRPELELHAAMVAAARFRHAGCETFLSLNASPDTLAGYGVLAAELGDRLVLEITEHEAIDDYDEVAARFDELRRFGARLAVDDTGAGFASLRHVLQLSPDIVKLDISLTRGIDRDACRRALASALTSFARELGAVIVAEGIETAAERDTLRKLGVTLGQGFFLAPPGPLATSRRRGPRVAL
jgi:EAL domain-containing protein (putative c-di-GMP-specific phosphodiesterase class I)/CheY-like chemotaxis protein